MAPTSTIASIFDGLRELENLWLGTSSEFVSVRSEESLESLEEHELILNAPDTLRDVDEGMTVVLV